jgi:hypothetical protein
MLLPKTGTVNENVSWHNCPITARDVYVTLMARAPVRGRSAPMIPTRSVYVRIVVEQSDRPEPGVIGS